MQPLYHRKKEVEDLIRTCMGESCLVLMRLVDLLNHCKPLSKPIEASVSDDLLARMALMSSMNDLGEDYKEFEKAYASDNLSIEAFNQMEEKLKRGYCELLSQIIEFSKTVLKARGRNEAELNQPIEDFRKLAEVISKAMND